jgi:MFS family permease
VISFHSCSYISAVVMTSQLPPTLRRRAPFRSQLAIIMMARLIEPMSITQLFPYINSMCEHLLPGTPKSNIGRYSGAAESAFAIGSFCFMYQWGKLSDRIGRKPTILWGLSGVGASAIAFGLSTNYYMALVSRLLGRRSSMSAHKFLLTRSSSCRWSSMWKCIRDSSSTRRHHPS